LKYSEPPTRELLCSSERSGWKLSAHNDMIHSSDFREKRHLVDLPLKSWHTSYQTLKRLHDPRSRNLLMANLWSYCDESGNHEQAAHTVVAAYFADGPTWDAFGEAWYGALAEEGLPCFHMTDCEGGWDDFSHLRHPSCRTERDRLQHKFISLINSFGLQGCVAGVCRRGFEANIADLQYHLGDKKYAFPYLYCFQECVSSVCALASDYPPHERVGFMFDRIPEFQGRANEMHSMLLDYEEWPHNSRLGAIAFDDKSRNPGLQAADILAYEAYKYLSDTRFGTKPKRWQMDLLQSANRLNDTYHTAEFFNELVVELNNNLNNRIWELLIAE